MRFDGNDVISNAYNPGTPYTVLSVSKLEGTQNQRLITSTANNWLLGYWSGGINRMYAEGWVTIPAAVIDTNPHLYAAMGSGPARPFLMAIPRWPATPTAWRRRTG